ncbi:MAG: ferric reductase-like transmembrane domain-containing protein [Bacteroidetes bacterium]|nr:ferric reductase-like transmembrane domain-containing protein [Bacteroidota bacterium]MCL6103583.1 ferric reductase-like transmembrane domain-containing protein [Bacteroidota bacterium]
MHTLKTRLKKHYLPSFLLILLFGLFLHFLWPGRDLITIVTDVTGYVAILAFTISLLIGPVNLLQKRNNPVSNHLRRDIGITGGFLAIVHSITGLFVHLRGSNWKYFLNKTDLGYTIRLDNFGLANYLGLLSALLILLVLVTSNDYSLRKMGQITWKNIQRLTYFLFVLAILHSVYYRVVTKNHFLIFYLYIPLFVLALLFQNMGIWLKLRDKKR